MHLQIKIIFPFLFFLNINAQTVTNSELIKQYMPNMPTSPSSASLFKFQEIALNEYNGSANINIPLVELSQIPLNLTYTATSGNRVNDQPGITGLGWDMNLGSIVQSISDIDDLKFFDSDYFKMRPDFQGYIYPSDSPYPCVYARSPYDSCDPVSSVYPVVSEIPINVGNKINFAEYTIYKGLLSHTADIINNRNFDSEPDIFTANFLGQSLTFINDFSKSTNAISFKVLNKEGYKITLNYINADNIKFVITNPSGIIYEFSALEKIKSESSTPSIYSPVDSRIWKLTKIITPNKRETTIDYIDIPNFISNSQYSQEFTKSKVLSKTHTSYRPFNKITLDHYGQPLMSYPEYVFVPAENSNGEYTNTYFSFSKQNLKLINSITSDEGKIDFYYSDRIDNPKLKKLDSITLNNQYSRKIKNIKFAYSYFSSTSSANVFTSGEAFTNINQTLYRLKLNSLIINDQQYDFTYNSINLPPRNSFAIDFWGYYNGSLQNTSIIPNPIQFKYYSHMGDNGNNLYPSEDYAKAAILEKITYPTKGYSTFKYELNEASNLFYSVQGEAQGITRGNGLRIREIANYDNDGTLATSKIYDYYGGTTMIPLLTARTATYDNTISHPSSTGYLYRVKVDRISSNNYFNVSPNGVSNYVGYGTVKITESGNTKNGYIMRTFQNRAENVAYLDNVKTINNFTFGNDDIDNGSLTSERLFDSNNKILKEKKLEYYKYRSSIDYGAKIGYYGQFFQYNMNGSLDELPRYQISTYPIFGKETLLKAEIEKEYFNDKIITTTTNYDYDSYRILDRTYKSNLVDGIFYDQTILNSNYYQNNIFTLPLSNHISINGKDKENTSYEYDQTLGFLVPKKITTNTLKNTAKILIYDNYDFKGNPVEFHYENDLHTVIIWGYNKTLPIAKIENATYAQIAAALGISTSVLNNYNETNLASINNLRNNASFTNSMITTYTHIPLVGVSSINDPKGDMMNYNYDNFGKLLSVKDAEGKLISENQYHYKN
ncbi:hypothetical protein PQ462_05485 [Flavobacterium sp. KACC 22758]|uniref:hypothetical protein n=1 Tax=Flavobacterium sp. KACC 22758 TaxID=3025667 RepID=UPI002365CF54|nr:hypothetical protein [Flavobacterium sp. KACC 22758]WDF60813.1 hypothetical protein PQ462_05485 [Flavobacterium sp. KACC 22758]